MAAKVPAVVEHRDYTGSVEQLNGLPPAHDQILLAGEVNDHTDVLVDHARLLDMAELKWHPGFTSRHAWVVDASGAKKSYYASVDADASQLASTAPGSDSAIWLAADDENQTPIDFAATYAASKVQN